MINNPTKEDILSPSAYKHLPAVRMEMQALAEKRDYLGAPFLKRKYRYLDGTYVLLHAMIGFNKIIMWGSGSYPHIVLTDHNGAWTYDWYKDAVISRSFASGYNGSDEVKPSFAGRSQIKDEAHLTYDGSWASAVIENPHNFDYIGGLNNYEMTLFKDGRDVYGRIGDLFGQVAQLPEESVMDAQQGGLYMFGAPYPVEWNNYSGLRGLSFNPANRNVIDSFYWIPAFFVAHPQDDFFLKPGFYYGKYPTCEYDIDNALESLTVTLKALCNTKHTEYGEYLYGWAEYVSERNGDPEFDLHIFLQSSPLSVPSNPNEGFVRIAGTSADRYITVGWAGDGFAPTVTLTLDASWVDFEMNMWNHGRWNDDDSDSLIPQPQQNGVSFVIWKGSKARAYRYTGALTLLMETEDYHSHSVSHDGTNLVLFEGQGEITHATAWDLYGTRELSVEGEGNYTRAAVTILADRTEVVGVGAVTACLIPNRLDVGTPEEYEPAEIDYNLEDFTGTPPIADYGVYLPSMGVIKFGRRGITPTFLKVNFTGLTAKYGISVDDCFQSTIVIEDPDVGVKEEQLVGSWRGDAPNTTIKGVVRGSFKGVHPNMRFTGIGDGETITLAENFAVIEHIDGTITFEGYSGELLNPTCVEDSTGEYRIDPLCSECGVDYQITASSSCGQTAERDYEVDPLPDIYITGNDVIGGQYVAYNTYGTVKWSVSCGTIDDDGNVSDTAGCCGAVTVSVEDECGRTASLDVRGLSGSWYLVDTSYWTGGPCNPDNYEVPGGCSQYDLCSPYCCFCDISSCYASDPYYVSPTRRKVCDRLPGWLPSGTPTCAGGETYSPVFTYGFFCTGDVPDSCSG